MDSIKETQPAPVDNVLVWSEPNTDVNPSLVSATLSFLVPAAIVIYLSIRTLAPAFDPRVFSGNTLGHALSGLPVLVTAVGALCVAVALTVRNYERSAELDLDGAEKRLANRIRNRPSLSFAEGELNPMLVISKTSQWEALEDVEIKSIRKAKKSLARRRSSARSLELTGSIVLFGGALLGAWAWQVGL